MSLPGSAPFPGQPVGQQNPQMAGMSDQEQWMVKNMTAAMESCPTKTLMATVAGGGMGALLGLFMSSMRYDAPGTFSAAAAAGGTSAATLQDLPWRQQISHGFRDMYKSSWSSAKSFGRIGAIFSGVECCIEGLRAKHDMGNSVSAGCITGGILARNGGPQAVAFGCAGFAAFSYAIDSYMNMPGEPKIGKIE